jgi:menaquinone-specific isochorismate synthase
VQEWFDEEFFQTGAFLELESGDFLFGKGGTSTWLDHLPHNLEEKKFYLKDFFNSRIREYSPSKTLTLSRASLPNYQQEKIVFSSKRNADELYQADFKRLMDHFGPKLNKVVLVSRESFSCNDMTAAQRKIFSRVIKSSVGIAYGFWGEGTGIMGVTPEILFDLNGASLKTYALAGTAAAEDSEKLLHSKKDRHEHEIVVRNIKEVLAPSVEKLEVEETHLHRFSNLIHLRTNMKAFLKKDLILSELLEKLSPTAALGGYPKEEALKFLKTTTYARSYPERIYGSTLGVSQKGAVRFAVLIRNIQWKADEFYIESGGGIVPDSTLENELNEIRLKRSTCAEMFLYE